MSFDSASVLDRTVRKRPQSKSTSSKHREEEPSNSTLDCKICVFLSQLMHVLHAITHCTSVYVSECVCGCKSIYGNKCVWWSNFLAN